MIEKIYRELMLAGIDVIKGASAKDYTTFRTGGELALVAKPADEEQIAAACSAADGVGLAYRVVGNGSDLLVSDRGYNGMIISLRENFAGIKLEPDGATLTARAGELLSRCASFAARESLRGLEFAQGIPGSVGGALYMNAGAYGGDIGSLVVKSRYYHNGSFGAIRGDAHKFGYRESIYEKNPGMIALSASFKLEKGDKAEIQSKMKEFSERRRASQPLEYPSAGSVFKRPVGHFAGRLIEDAGLKGRRVGGAEVSTQHAGFIINRGGATSGDVYSLIKQIQKEVYEKFAVELCPEVQLIGEFE